MKQPGHLSKRRGLRWGWTPWGAFQRACRCCWEHSAALPRSDVPLLHGLANAASSTHARISARCCCMHVDVPAADGWDLHTAALCCVDQPNQLVGRPGYNRAVSCAYLAQTQESAHLCLLTEQNILLNFKLALHIMSKTHDQKYGGISVLSKYFCFLKILERWTLSWLSLGGMKLN